ncbi:hypothetical protein PENTCL1PPCAC_21032, partial [Pristionchus entomophagus]
RFTSHLIHSLSLSKFFSMLAATILLAVILPFAESAVTCTSCELKNATDCTGTPCDGNYCKYERTKPLDGMPFVRRSCAYYNYAEFPDGTKTEITNQCDKATIDGVEYAFEVCNCGDLCDTHCNSGTRLFSIFSIVLLPVIYVTKY